MIYKELCGERLSRLGMGNMRLPTKGEGMSAPIDEEKAQEIIDYVYASGVNYYDTAYMYHGGESERFIGRALKKYPRESYHLASKMPNYPLAERSVGDIFEEQLQKCGVDYFDFYLLHNLSEGSVDTFTDPEKGVIPYLLEQKKNGRIRHLGLSSHAKPETLERFLDSYDCFEFVQIQLNYLDWDLQDAKRQYEIITDHGMPVWVMEPCRGGRLASLSEKADALLKAAEPNRSIASWAFRYVASLPNVGVILSGMTLLPQAQDNVKTFSEEAHLTEKEQATLAQALELMRQELNVPCTACHYCDGCPMELDIPGLLSIYNAMAIDKNSFTAMAQLEQQPKKPDACIACGACKEKCPQRIDIPAVMDKFSRQLAAMPRRPGPPPKKP